MKPTPVHTFTSIPSLPPALERLRELAYNLRWAWDEDTLELFRRLGGPLWAATGHNPVLLLGTVSQEMLGIAATDEGFMAHMERVLEDFDAYLSEANHWFHRKHGAVDGPMVAYFSAEFGLTECLSIFAGGLGVLAGDHLKSASDLGLPFVGVGLLYQQGYFRQYLNKAGWQQEAYEENDFSNLPLTLERAEDGRPLMISVAFPNRSVFAQVWRVHVGRVALYLLDTNVIANTRPEDRDLTDYLYGGDLEIRMQQELMLGIGGYRALKALGLAPTVYHMNEGHSSFLSLERIRQLIEVHGLAFHEAREAASGGLVFTTHTPVEAGHDRFPPDMMDRYFSDYYNHLGLSRRDFLALGRQNPDDEGERFCMTTLALGMAAHSNGVSRLHGVVSRQMWQRRWPSLPEEEVPITHVTNGVHYTSWVSLEMKQLYDRYLGPRWREDPADPKVWERSEAIAPEELWRTHMRRRERLVSMARNRLQDQVKRIGASRTEIEAAQEVLDPRVLTIGFARRFATYKRAMLLLKDPDRLARIMNNPDRPVQFIFAGKAHPKDNPGKELIQQIVAFSREERFRRHLVFLADYDMSIARYMVQGVDVWLNTPQRPREASGTSGMKAAANGVLNLSVLDGWWDEAYQPNLGWAIGQGEMYDDEAYRDQVEAESLYNLLEREVVPLFYDRSVDGLPRRWISRVKKSLAILGPVFNTHRMVQEYTERFYLPASQRYLALTTKKMARAKTLAQWHQRVREHWPKVRVDVVDREALDAMPVGHSFNVQALVHLGTLKPDDVVVELYLGRINAANEIVDARALPMTTQRAPSAGTYLYETNTVTCKQSGLHGFTVRVLPNHPDQTSPYLAGLVSWA